MTAIEYALTTTARVKERLDIDVSDHDTRLDGMVNGVTAFIEKYCGGRRFKQTTHTQEIYNGNMLVGDNKSFLVLRNAPVSTLTTFQYRTGSKSNPTWVTFQENSFEEMNSVGIIKVHGGLPRGEQNLRVTYTAGYLIDFANYGNEDLHTLPYELTELAERLVTKIFKKREAEGLESQGFDNANTVWRQLLDESDITILENYRRQHFV